MKVLVKWDDYIELVPVGKTRQETIQNFVERINDKIRSFDESYTVEDIWKSGDYEFVATFTDDSDLVNF